MSLPVITHPEQEDMKSKDKGISLCAFLDTVRPRKDKTYTVRIRIIYGRFPKYYTTKINLSEDDYLQVATGKPRGELKSIKVIIHQNIKRAYDIILNMNSFSFEQFDKKYLGKLGEWKDVFTAFESHIKNLKQNKQIGTASTYQTTFNSIKKFYKKSELLFSDITVNFLKNYESWLKREGKSVTTVSMNTRCIRRLYNIAISKGDAKREFYPFGSEDLNLYEPPAENNIKKALSKDDLKKIFKYKAEDGSQEQYYRDIFIFSYLGNGMNINDIARLKYSNIHNNEIEFVRKKTSTKRKIKSIQVSINSDMDSIIKKYGSKPVSKNNFIFDILTDGLTPEQETARIKQTTKQCNKYLKTIAGKIGIDENISTYYARHSFASILKHSGESISYISEAMGHSNTQTTENYLSSFDSEKRKEAQKKLTDWKKK